jgi:hypothetical protein
MKNVEVVTLIYKSIDYLHFITDQLLSDLCKADGWKVGVRVVANDATPEVLEELSKINIPFTIHNNPDPNEYYLNRVYRAFNFCVQSSEYDNVVLVNSDCRFSDNWLPNLLKHHDGINIPCGRLVESGKMPSGQHGVNLWNMHFGRHPKEFDVDKWNKWVERNSSDEIRPGGLYGPVVFEKARFLEAGGYPEGNLYADGPGTLNGPVIKCSDDAFFHEILEARYGMKHITVFDCLVYHIQEGEKDE